MQTGDLVVASTVGNQQPALKGSITVQNSSRVHVGHRTYYNAPVTVLLPDTKLTLSPEQLNKFERKSVEETVVPEAKFRLSKKKIIILTAAVVAIVIVVVVAAVLSQQRGSTRKEEWRIVGRAEWHADPPRGKLDPLAVTPPSFVIISHSNTPPCYTPFDCRREVKYIQELQFINTDFFDIAYNFLVGGDGLAYEGRGWDASGSHTKNVNNVSIGINFIGNFIERIPPQAQIDSFFKLVDFGRNNSKLTPDYKIHYARQFRDTISPGDKFIELIKTWDRWAPVSNETTK